MITFVKLVCPNCGANLEVDSKLSQCFCQYCGTKILLHNENEHIERYVNEAELARQENERRRIEFEQKKYADKKAERDEPNWPILVAILMGFGSLIPAIAGITSLTRGGFLNFLVGVLALAFLICVWYGYRIAIGRTALKPKLGLIIMFVSGILCVLFTRFAYQLFPPA